MSYSETGDPNPERVRSELPPSRSRARLPGLHVRFVVRMSGEVSDAIKAAARREGITAGAWVRRTVLERLELRSERDERSGRPLVATDADLADVATAIRELAGVSAAISVNDKPTAKARLDVARCLLIPVVVRRSGR